MELWLIRTVENEIARPYTRIRLLELIREGALTFRDEVCRANDYWIGLNELEEVRAKLGSDVPELLRASARKKVKAAGGDAAGDATEELTADVDLEDPTEPVDVTSGRSSESSGASSHPWYGSTPERATGATRVSAISPNGVRGGSGAPQGKAPLAPPPRVKVPDSSLPQNSLLQALGVSLALAALIAVYWVIRLLRME